MTEVFSESSAREACSKMLFYPRRHSFDVMYTSKIHKYGWEHEVNYQRIYYLTREYGIYNRKLPYFAEEQEEIAVYGKPIREFTIEENYAYDDTCESLENFFETVLPSRQE